MSVFEGNLGYILATTVMVLVLFIVLKKKPHEVLFRTFLLDRDREIVPKKGFVFYLNKLQIKATEMGLKGQKVEIYKVYKSNFPVGIAVGFALIMVGLIFVLMKSATQAKSKRRGNLDDSDVLWMSQ